ncbi:efflux RND transporter periplasmic adaptor subunit [Draconibacterium sp. IB214405]|uniref:efflux RND transporter periplasmic adaptor subunit n=1 Tax=Draconibacterium sp. IB214405 TaxID=3097352 RepID=UPI002A15F2DA|nr:efflux RND transporter periplasmic adaptor subunit [Draconibacterium sp. IB214405]MDX8338976.1 efflux RND transporter periplasmic adaptor subunit [Draconibacterium sp. IB214405]
MKKKTIIIIALLLVVLVSAALILKPNKVDISQIDIQTGKAGSGSISTIVESTGTLEAITTVEVGTQVSGIVDHLFVDYNSYVKKGQLLAKIDTTNLAAQLEQSQATLDNAKAELDYQQATYDRMAPLNEKQLISQTDYDQYIYNLNKAKASYNNALAQHKKNQINLDYALIYSPIDGVVLNKEVEEGQTVAASFNTPTLFTIANDLTQMQVEADIDEADIGQIKEGQRVEFTVDAYPETTFQGEVTQLRWEPTVTNNVVTYTIIIDAPNPDYKLMPGMTATIQIYVLEKNDILVVPSKALRFTPDQKLLMSYMSQQGKPEMPEGQTPPEMGAMPQQAPGGANDATMVWVKEGTSIHPVPVKIGLNDDINAEIISGIKSGQEVVLSMEQKGGNQTAARAAGNPFMPGPPGRR